MASLPFGQGSLGVVQIKMDFTSICSKVIFIISLFHVIMRGGVGVTPHRVEEDIFNIRKC